MISGFSNERVSYRTRYLNFPSTLTENVPSISKPTIHVIKIRFNNIFKNEKAIFAAISITLSVVSLLVGYALYSVYNNITEDEMISGQNTVAMEELKSISAEDAGITVMNKSSFGVGSTSSSQQGGNYLSYNNGPDPNAMLLASNNGKETTSDKEVLTSKRAVVDVDEKTVVNPFLPISEIEVVKTKKVVKPNPNFILPPTSLGTNSTANILLRTSIAGIMYDSYNPSAIVKINDTDYLVRKGDKINGYQILNIQPKTVTIQLGANVYKAPVGIILANLDQINNTDTINLDSRFGGPKNKR